MALQLLMNAVLFVFFTVCVFNASATLPASVAGQLSAKQWSMGILALILFFLIVNMINIYRGTPKEERNLSSITGIRPAAILKSKLFWGMASLVLYALLIRYLGFLLCSLLFCFGFSMLLGEKKEWRAAVFSLVVTVVLYLLFYKGMGIMLPRGEGFLRDISLAIESLLRQVF